MTFINLKQINKHAQPFATCELILSSTAKMKNIPASDAERNQRVVSTISQMCICMIKKQRDMKKILKPTLIE